MTTTETLARVLIVDDEAAQMKALCNTLEPEGYVTAGFSSASEALTWLSANECDLVLTDLMMPEMDGIAFLQAARRIDPGLVAIVMTGHGTIDTAVKAMQAGALDYILKPFKLSAVLTVLTRALAVRRLRAENIELREAAAIHQLSMAITHRLEPDDVLHKTAQAALEQGDATRVAIWLPTPNGEYRLAVALGELAEAGIAKDTLWTEVQIEQGMPGVCLPMVAHGERLGILCFQSARRIRPGQLKGLSILASASASALSAGRLLNELRVMNDELERRVRERTVELEQANADLESFSYSVSHDLRAPLRAVHGFCQIYLTEFADSIPAEGREYLDHVMAGAERMTRLIEDLLTLARFSRQPLLDQAIAVEALVRRIMEGLVKDTGGRLLEIRMEGLRDCRGDASLLEQVFVNLLSNAVKFTSGRNPGVVEIGCREEEAHLLYWVRDNGAGFNMKYADKLFGVFQRLHSTTEFEGTGVGLSIVRRIVERHGGRVWAESKVDHGATFFVTIPRSAAP